MPAGLLPLQFPDGLRPAPRVDGDAAGHWCSLPAMERWASLTTALPCMSSAADLTHPFVCLAAILRHTLQLPDTGVLGPWAPFVTSTTPGRSLGGPVLCSPCRLPSLATPFPQSLFWLAAPATCYPFTGCPPIRQPSSLRCLVPCVVTGWCPRLGMSRGPCVPSAPVAAGQRRGVLRRALRYRGHVHHCGRVRAQLHGRPVPRHALHVATWGHCASSLP